jgi:hypothetical protein
MTVDNEGTRPLQQSLESELDRLATLQDLDRHLHEKTELILTLERAAAAMDQELAAHRDAVVAARAERDARDQQRRELEARLDEEENKMKDRRMRLNRVRNEKELSALRREIEIGKEANQATEAEVLTLLQAVENLDGSLAERERELAASEEKCAGQIVEHRQRIAALAGEVESERIARDVVANSLSSELRQKYEQIFARRRGTAVVAIRNGICQGCRMHVPPQFFNELQKYRDVRLCPNCHRILIYRPEPVADAPAR